MPEQRRHRTATRAVNIGLAANMLLAAVKMTVGILGRSSALLADGINSTSDVAYYLVVKIFMHFSRKPPDEEHPYGHSQLESISAMVVGCFIITTAVAIFWGAIRDAHTLWIRTAESGGASRSALWAALFTVVLKILLACFTRRVGRRTGHAAVLALADDHRNDILSAAGVAIGIFFGRAGWPWMDPLTGAFVALAVLWSGISILRDTSADLMDTVPGRVIAEQVTALARRVPGVEKLEEISAHRFGPYLMLNLIIGVNGSLSVAEGDRIATELEGHLREEMGLVRRVYVHYHPTDGHAGRGESETGGVACRKD